MFTLFTITQGGNMSYFIKQLKGELFSAFSLVEMLMALLVASLLLAALAPVMTKRFGENVSVSGTGGSGVRSDYQRAFYKDTEWTVPNGVNAVHITAIGGGGSGGGATYGFKEVTANESDWIVPDNVTKIRVFMTGAGGSGASGGQEISWQYADIPALNNAEGQILTAGTHAFVDIIIPPDDYKAPELHHYCTVSGVSKWVFSSDGATEIYPNSHISKVGGNGNVNITLNKVTACGAGGGNAGYTVSYGGFGGSGGYINETNINYTALANNISFGIGAPGTNGGTVFSGAQSGTKYAVAGTGGSGFNGQNGTNGTQGVSTLTYTGSGQGVGGGGGGGGATGAKNGGNVIFSISGGGGGGGGVHGTSSTGYSHEATGGTGGSGGGTSPGLGGGGAILGVGKRISGKGASGYVTGMDGIYDGVYNSSGGGGGGGIGGIGGGNDNLDSIFGANNCNTGRPGAVHLWYSVPTIANGLKCPYKDKANSGGGGGAGQIWIGEIDVRGGQSKISFNIGEGGKRRTTYSSGGDSGNGGSTSITVDGVTYSVSGGKGGVYETDNTYIENSGGLGGGVKKNNFSPSARYVNWLNIPEDGGLSGEKGNSTTDGAGGGRGGNTRKKDGTLALGGEAVGSHSDGIDALSGNYGAGGSGGGGVTEYGGTPGYGGKGANGYIYIEWGNANGGGGSSGQVIKRKNVWVSAGTKIKIKIGKGGIAKDVLTTLNGVNGFFGQKGDNGEDSYVITTEGEAIRAKGGLGGYPAGTNHGKGGNCDTCEDKLNYSNKGEDGTDNYGGAGGNITEELFPLINSLLNNGLDGLGGCGGNMVLGTCANSSNTPFGKNAAKIGGGGGGGSVKNNSAYKGGNGGDGMVVIEWTN